MKKEKDNFNWLRMILNARGVSQRALADAIGEAPPNFSKVMNGQRSYKPDGPKFKKLKKVCEEWLGLTSADWKNPPRPFYGASNLDEAFDRFLELSSEALLSWKWRRVADIDIVLNAVDAALLCSEKLSLRAIICILEPMSDCLHERRDYVRWARWVRKAQQSLEFSSAGIQPLLLQVLKCRCTALAAEIARHEKFEMNLRAQFYRKQDGWKKEEERLKNEVESTLKNLIRPNFEAAVDALVNLTDELEFCKNTSGFEAVLIDAEDQGKTKRNRKSNSNGRNSGSIQVEDILRYARFCLIRARLQLGGYLSFSSVSEECLHAVTLLTLAAKTGRDLVSESMSVKTGVVFPFIGSPRRVFYTQSCIIRRLAREFAKRSSSSTVPYETALQHRSDAKKLYDEAEFLAERAIDSSGAGVREQRNLVRTLSWTTMFLLDCQRVGRGFHDGLLIGKEKTDKAARILRAIAGDGNGDSFKPFPMESRNSSASGKLPFDTELAIRMFIEVRIQPVWWNLPLLPNGVKPREALANLGLPYVRRYFEVVDAYRHLFKSRSFLVFKDGETIPRRFIRGLYDGTEMGSHFQQDLFYHARDPEDRKPLSDPFEGVDFSSIPSWPTQLDLTSRMLAERQVDWNGLPSPGTPVFSRMAKCMEELTSTSPGVSQGRLRLDRKTDLSHAIRHSFRQLHEANKKAAENNSSAEAKERYYSEIQVLQRPDHPFLVEEICSFEKAFFDKNREGDSQFPYDRTIQGKLSPLEEELFSRVSPVPASVGLGFAGPVRITCDFCAPVSLSVSVSDVCTQCKDQEESPTVKTLEPSDNSLLRALFFRWTRSGTAVRSETDFRNAFGLTVTLCSKILSAQSPAPVPEPVRRKIAEAFGLDPVLLNPEVWERFRTKRESTAIEWLKAATARIGFAPPPPTASKTDVECENRFKDLLQRGTFVMAFCGMAPSDERLIAATELLPVLSSAKHSDLPPVSLLRSSLRSSVLFEPEAPNGGTKHPVRAFLAEKLARTDVETECLDPPSRKIKVPVEMSESLASEWDSFNRACKKLCQP